MSDIVQVVDTLTPMSLIERAVSSGASVDTLERLMTLQERYDVFTIVRATNPFRGPDVIRRGLAGGAIRHSPGRRRVATSRRGSA